jgi:integrase
VTSFAVYWNPIGPAPKALRRTTWCFVCRVGRHSTKKTSATACLRQRVIGSNSHVFRGHSFRHTHATLLTEVGESIKTAQSLLGHSDLGTTLNTYAHVIPDSQRRAVERVADVLFSSVLESEENTPPAGRTN